MHDRVGSKFTHGRSHRSHQPQQPMLDELMCDEGSGPRRALALAREALKVAPLRHRSRWNFDGHIHARHPGARLDAYAGEVWARINRLVYAPYAPQHRSVLLTP